MIARRLRLAFLNVQAAQEALPGIVDIMAEELKWTEDEKKKQQQAASDFLATEMGHSVNRQSRDKIPINLTKDEIQLYIKRFQIIDKDRKGYVSINDIRRGLKVRISMIFCSARRLLSDSSSISNSSLYYQINLLNLQKKYCISNKIYRINLIFCLIKVHIKV